MKTIVTIFTLCFLVTFSHAQEVTTVKAVVVNNSNEVPLENVNIVNLNQVIGVTTNEKGEFELKAQANDTLHFSYVGFKSIKVRVTNDWIKYGSTQIAMTELALALDEVVITEFKLTGYLEIDIKQVPINNNYRYSISGLPSGYEAGSRQPSALSKVLGSIFNPIDFLYNTFSKKGREMKKLKKMKKDDEIRALLASRFDREMLTVLLQINKVDLDEIISQCNYSKEFIETANDLQILDAISECYEEYKILSKSRKNKI